MSRYIVSFIYKDTISSVQHLYKCSNLLQVDYLKIIQQDQRIYIRHKRSGPTAPIETIDIVTPTPPIPSYLEKSDLDNIIQQTHDILSISEQYTAQHSSIM